MQATEAAMARADRARSVVLVEGVSDQIAVETLATRQGRDLVDEGVVVVPIGGAHAIARFLRHLRDDSSEVRLGGMCDAAEEMYFRKALAAAGIAEPGDRFELERAGFFVCVDDLEDELIRAVGQSGVEAVLAAEGDLGSFRTLQKQQPWREAPFDAQMRRFLGAGSRRKLRYARLLVLALDAENVPRPLAALLTRMA